MHKIASIKILDYHGQANRVGGYVPNIKWWRPVTTSALACIAVDELDRDDAVVDEC